MSWAEDLLKVIELKIRYFFAVWIFGALLIFLPEEIKTKMAVTIPENIRPWIGFATLAFFVLWFVLAIIHVISYLHSKYKDYQMRDDVLDQLNTLSDRERDIFIFCLSRNQRTIQRNITDGAVNSLMTKRLLTIARQGSVLSMPYTIPDFVWKRLQKKRDVLFPEFLSPEEMAKFVNRQRDGWMR